LAGLKDFGDSKVNQYYPPVLVKHDVGWFDITVDNRRTVAVKVIQNVADLNRPLDDPLLREEIRALIQRRFQVLALDELHDQIAAITLAEIVENLGDGRVA
jgi:hypothetical protein